MELMNWMIRNFPKPLHKRAKVRAAEEEISLKDLVVKAVEEYLEKVGG